MAKKMPQVSDKTIIIIAIIGLTCLGLSMILPKADKDFTENLKPEASNEVQEVDATFNLDAAKKERILGNPNAPIKISEHSSLTCPHCASFHTNVLPTFKTKYIDTGKAYLVFSDFPLNAPAMHGSMVARCIGDNDSYFSFLDDLFKNQDQWVNNAYKQNLKDKATALGMSETLFDTCINSNELQEHLVSSIKANQTLYNVNSTPSFVVNNQEVITGTSDFASFEKRFLEAVEDIGLSGALSDETAETPEQAGNAQDEEMDALEAQNAAERRAAEAAANDLAPQEPTETPSEEDEESAQARRAAEEAAQAAAQAAAQEEASEAE